MLSLNKMNLCTKDKYTFSSYCPALVRFLCNSNKMQSQTADFAPGAATWQTGRNMRRL